MDTELEPWRHAWRNGFAPVLPTAGLVALAEALRADDGRLTQTGHTTFPPVENSPDLPVEAACAAGFCLWRADGLVTAREVNGAFNRLALSLATDDNGKDFLNFWDKTPRAECFAALLPEVERELARRGEGVAVGT